jgi:hypothetical protein
VEGKCWIYQNQIATTSVDKWLNVVAKMADHRYPAAKKIVGENTSLFTARKNNLHYPNPRLTLCAKERVGPISWQFQSEEQREFTSIVHKPLPV